MSEVLVSVKGTQIVNGEENVTEITGEGCLEIKNGRLVITYDEDALIGGNVKAKLSVLNSNTLVLDRSGDISTRMIIEKGVRHNCNYNTPYGAFTMGFFGTSMENTMTEQGGVISMCYTVDRNSTLLSENKIEITVKRLG